MPSSDNGSGRRAQAAFLRVTQNPALKRSGQAVVRSLATRANYHVVRGMADPSVRPDVKRSLDAVPWSITTDYVRHGTLELLAREIEETAVPGALAELGVFAGDFSYLMATLLPGRPLHLFDTFRGFDDRDVAADASEELVEDFIDFSPTDAERVRRRMPDPGLVHLHVGWFPDTTVDVPEDVRFALVSLDADLYGPILAGLDWFYDRLSPGGYILVHDYNNCAFGGTKKAAREFQERTGAALVPIPDWGGTVVVTRPAAPA